MSLKKPVRIFINENTDTAMKLRLVNILVFLLVSPPLPFPNVHKLIYCRQEFVRIRAGRETDREAIVSALITRTFQENTIVFVKTKKDCARMQILLGLLGIKVRYPCKEHTQT